MTLETSKGIRSVAAAIALSCVAATAAYAGGNEPAAPQDSPTAPVHNTRPSPDAPPALQITPGEGQGTNDQPVPHQTSQPPQTARMPNAPDQGAEKPVPYTGTTVPPPATGTGQPR